MQKNALFYITPAEAREWAFTMGMEPDLLPTYNSVRGKSWGGHLGKAIILIANQESDNTLFNLADAYVRVRTANPLEYVGEHNQKRSDLINSAKHMFSTAISEAQMRIAKKGENILDALVFLFGISEKQFHIPHSADYGVVLEGHISCEDTDFAGMWATSRGKTMDPFSDAIDKKVLVDKFYASTFLA